MPMPDLQEQFLSEDYQFLPAVQSAQLAASATDSALVGVAWVLPCDCRIEGAQANIVVAGATGTVTDVGILAGGSLISEELDLASGAGTKAVSVGVDSRAPLHARGTLVIMRATTAANSTVEIGSAYTLVIKPARP